MSYKCPICSYGNLKEDPKKQTYEICPRCGIEFGLDNWVPIEEGQIAKELLEIKLRERWIKFGMPNWEEMSEVQRKEYYKRVC